MPSSSSPDSLPADSLASAVAARPLVGDVRTSDVRTSDVLARMRDAYVRLDRDFRFVAVNPAAERALGKTRDELLGRTHWEAFPASVGSPVEAAYRRVAAEGGETHLTHRYVGEGYDVHLEIDAYGSMPPGVVDVFWRDVTSRASAQAGLAVSDARYRALLASIDTGFCVIEVLDERDAPGRPVDYRFLETNPAFVAQSGFDPLADGSPSRRMREIAPDHEAFWFETYGRVALTGEPARFTHEAVALGRWFDVVAYRVDDPALRRVAVLFDDVTAERTAGVERERLLAAERLAAGRARLLQTLTAPLSAALTPEAVVRVVLEHGVPALGATTGLVMLTVDDGSGAALTFAGAHGYPPGFDARFARVPLDAALPIAQAAREHRPVWVRDPEAAGAYPALAAVYAATGTAATAALPLADGDGRVIGALAFNYPAPRAFDAEGRAFKEAVARQCAQALERARLFAAERAARAAAEAANQAKGLFLANMSHELRTPLNAIGGYAQLLELGLHGPVTDDQRGALSRIQTAQTRLLALINDILNYAKLEAGRVEYDLGPVDVGAVVAEVAPLLEPQVRAKGLAFDVRLPGAPCVVWADREKLGQVLVNLLANAVKFTDAPDPGIGAPGRVTVSLAARATGPDGGRPGLAFLRVTDTGRGIPRAKQDAIFEPFVQVRRGYAQATEGTGLGLAISRDLARGMGGDLRVRSEEGRGSTFTVSLRRVADAGPSEGRRTGE